MSDAELKVLGALKREQAEVSSSGIIPTTCWYYGAWQFLLSYDKADRLWMFSAMLYPAGRGSTVDDWRVLGVMVAAVKAPIEATVGDTISTSPNAVHKWAWTEPPEGTPMKKGEEVFFPASCKMPAPTYVGDLVRCFATLPPGTDLRCWHLQGHVGNHEDQEWAESDGERGTTWAP